METLKIKSKKTNRTQYVTRETWDDYIRLGFDRRFLIIGNDPVVPKENVKIIEKTKKGVKKND